MVRLASLLFLAALLSFVLVGTASAQTFEYGLALGAEGGDRLYGADIDAAGNVFIGGNIQGTLDLDPTDGPDADDTVEASEGGNNALLASYDADGGFRWGMTFAGGSNNHRVRALVVDAAGNVYITGFVRGEADFDPSDGPDAEDTVNTAFSSLFLASYTGEGAFRWVVVSDSDNYSEGVSLALDTEGNLYVTGLVDGTTDFDPTNGAGATDTYQGKQDIFLASYTGEGDFRWMLGFGSSAYEFGRGVTVTEQGNVYLVGELLETVDFDPSDAQDAEDTRTSAGADDGFLASYTTDGQFQWVRQFSGPGVDNAHYVTADAEGRPYVNGTFEEALLFEGSMAEAYTSQGDQDAFLAAYDADGNVRWTTAWGSAGLETVGPLHVPNDGHLYLGGQFEGTVDFDAADLSDADDTFTAAGRNAMVVTFTADGAYRYGWAMGGSTGEDISFIQALAVRDGRLVVGGLFFQTLDLDLTDEADTDDTLTASSDAADAFLAAFTLPDADPTATETAEALPRHLVLHGTYPNPFNPTTTLHFDLAEAATVQVRLYDVLGRDVLALPAQVYPAGASQTLRVDAGALPSGVYVYRMTARLASGTLAAQNGQMTLLR